MASILHVNGPTPIYTGTGSVGALELLGYSVDGITPQFNSYDEPVYTDKYGPMVPYDVQYFLQDATISLSLIDYDVVVLKKVLGSFAGSTPGVMAAAGSLYLANAGTFRVVLRSTPSGTGITGAEDCINFLNCYLKDKAEVPLGVRKSVWNLTFRALLPQQATSAVGAVLYNFSCT